MFGHVSMRVNSGADSHARLTLGSCTLGCHMDPRHIRSDWPALVSPLVPGGRTGAERRIFPDAAAAVKLLGKAGAADHPQLPLLTGLNASLRNLKSP